MDRGSQCESNYQWPHTIQPSEGEWWYWQQALTKSLLLNQWQQLSNLLGDWLEGSSPMDWYFEKPAHIIEESGWGSIYKTKN